MLLENGKYQAVVRDVHLYERGDNKRLTAAFKLECEGKELINREWLELNDGTISEKTLQRLRKCFPAWDGTIEALDEGHCCRDIEVEIVVENESDQQDPGKLWTRVRFMNPPGAAGKSELPERLDRGTLAQRYGSRFRALSGGVPVPSPSALPPPKAGPPAPPQRPPEKQAPTSSLEECWDLLCKEQGKAPRAAVESAWFKLLEKAVPGKDSGDFTPEDWGRVKAALSDLPY